MSVFPLLVIVHALAATVWTGGHLVLDLGFISDAEYPAMTWGMQI